MKDDPKQLKSAAHPPGLGRFKSDPYFLSMYSIWYHAKCVRAFTGDMQDQVHPQGLRTIPKAAVRHSNKCGQLHQPLQPRCAMCTAHTGSSVPVPELFLEVWPENRTSGTHERTHSLVVTARDQRGGCSTGCSQRPRCEGFIPAVYQIMRTDRRSWLCLLPVDFATRRYTTSGSMLEDHVSFNYTVVLHLVIYLELE